MADGEEPWIVSVQETVGNLIEKPKMSAKYLQKPPFKFLHETICGILEKTGFAPNLLTDDDKNPEVAGNGKDNKLSFLNKVMDAVSEKLGTQASLKPSKCIAGADAESTSLFLVELFNVATGKIGGKPAAKAPEPANDEAAEKAKKEEERQRRKEKEKAEREKEAAAAAAAASSMMEKEKEKEKERRKRDEAGGEEEPRERKREKSKERGPAAVESMPSSPPAPQTGERVEIMAANTTTQRPTTSTARRPPRSTTANRPADVVVDASMELSSPTGLGGGAGGPPPGRRIFTENSDDDSDEDLAAANKTAMGSTNGFGRLPRKMLPQGGESDSDEEGGEQQHGIGSRIMANVAAHNRAYQQGDGDDDEENGGLGLELTGQSIGKAQQSGSMSPSNAAGSSITFKRKTSKKGANDNDLKEVVGGLQAIVDGAVSVAKTMAAMDVIKASVRTEVDNWRGEAETQAELLREAQEASQKELVALDEVLRGLGDKIAVTETRISEARERILRNEARISKLLSAVVAQ